MTSGKKARQQRRTPPPPPVRSTGARQASPKVLAIAAAVILLAGGVAAAAIVATRGSSKSGGPATPLPQTSAAVSLLRGIPQHGNVLGSPSAPVTMLTYIDLQCSSCRQFETTVMPTILRKYVRPGKVKVEARPIVVIGPDSERGARGAIAAGRQNAFFTFAQILYYNQGAENGGWLTDQVVEDAASGIPGLQLAAFRQAFDSSSVKSDVSQFDSESKADHVSGTPTVYVSRGNGPRHEVAPGFIPSVAQLSAAIDAALRQ